MCDEARTDGCQVRSAIEGNGIIYVDIQERGLLPAHAR